MEWLLNDPTVVASIAALKAAVVALAAGVLVLLARILWGLRPLLELVIKEWLQNLLNKRLGDAAARQVGQAITDLGSNATPETLKAKVPALVRTLEAKFDGTLKLAGADASTARTFVQGEMGKIIASTPPPVEVVAAPSNVVGLKP